MSIQELKDGLPDFAKDIRLNIGTVLSEDGAPGLRAPQIWGIALSAAYATLNDDVIQAIRASGDGYLTPEVLKAAQGAATIMAMNNVYYRSIHLVEDEELAKMPARLRMNIIGNPGIAKVDFELYSLAVSAIAGCGNCLKAHSREVTKAGISLEGVQSTIRIAAVIKAAAQASYVARLA